MTTVLYVDDEPPLRRAVHAWLKRRGTVVHSAPGIEAAKECLAKHAVDGVFIDLWLTDGSGFELFDWLAEFEPELARNVAFVTGDIVRTPATQRQLGMLGRPLITKPFDLTELDHFVELWARAEPVATPDAPTEIPGSWGPVDVSPPKAAKPADTRVGPLWEERPGA